MSRFGRDYLIVGNYISKVFPFLGVRFIAVNDGIDSIRPQDIDSLDTSFKALLYDLYSRDLSRKVRSAERFRAQRGEFLSPFAPYGYVKDPANSKRLIIDPPAAEVVHRIFQMVASGLTTIQIARTLNSEAIPTPMVYKRISGCSRTLWPCVHENNFWTHNAVGKIVRDERYLGKNIYRKRVRDIVGSVHSVKNKRADWIVAEGMHESIVTQQEFDLAQAAMRDFAERNGMVQTHHVLRGKVRCGVCEHFMARINKKVPHYYCQTPKVSALYDCPDEPVREQDILDAVLEGLHIRAAAAVEMSRLWDEQRRQSRKDINSMKKTLVLLRESRDQQAQHIRELYESFAMGEISKPEYLAAKSAAAKQRDDITSQIARLEAVLEDTASDGKLQNEFVAVFQGYTKIQQLSREVAVDVLKEIRVYPDNRLEIIWNYQQDFERLTEDLLGG